MRQMFSAVCPFCKETFTKPRRGNQPYRYCSRGCAMRSRNASRVCMTDEERIQARRDAVRRWRQSHREANKAQKRRYYARHADRLKTKMRPRNKARTDQLRKAVLAYLGDKCQRCGFTDERALHIDHVNGGGRIDRAQFGNRERFLRHVLSASLEDYQLLCANCNSIKKHENHEYGKGTPKVLPFQKRA